MNRCDRMKLIEHVNSKYEASRNIPHEQAKQEIWNLLASSLIPPEYEKIANQLKLSLDLVIDISGEIDELESIRAFDAATITDDEVIPFEQAIDEIEQNHQGLEN